MSILELGCTAVEGRRGKGFLKGVSLISLLLPNSWLPRKVSQAVGQLGVLPGVPITAVSPLASLSAWIKVPLGTVYQCRYLFYGHKPLCIFLARQVVMEDFSNIKGHILSA